MSVKNEAVHYRILRNLNTVITFGKATILALIVVEK
jgi:hypothetical protein